jgi:uncharacterized membrane protein YbhN (UPF0104 family)
MRTQLLKILKYLLFFSLGIFLVWWSIHKMDDKNWEDCKASLREARYWLFLPVFAILAISHISRAIRWKILMKPLGMNPGLTNTFFAVMIGYLANLAIPRLGEILKCTILSKYEKAPVNKLVGTIIIERAVDLVSLAIVFVIAVVSQASVIGAYARETLQKYFFTGDSGTVALKTGIAAGIFLLVFLAWKFIIHRYAHINLVAKVKSMFQGITEGLASISTLENRWAFIGHSILIWCCYLVATYIGFYAIAETSFLPVEAAFPVLAFGSIGMIITPGGIGTYPLLVTEVMQLYHIERGHAFANGNLQWLAQSLIILIVGFICLLLLPGYNNRKKAGQQHTGVEN